MSKWLVQAVGDCRRYTHTCNLSSFEIPLVCLMVRAFHPSALSMRMDCWHVCSATPAAQVTSGNSVGVLQVAWPCLYLSAFVYFLVLARRQVQTQPWGDHRISNTHTRLQVRAELSACYGQRCTPPWAQHEPVIR